MAEKFQAVVIGGGPGGYVCAIRLSQLGFKTACVEARNTLGGTCLNVGCIPSKSLLNLSENFQKAKKLQNLGIEVGEVKLNLEKMMKNKEKSVSILTKGVEFLFKKNKVSHFNGTGSIASANEVLVTTKDNKKISLNTDNIIISTGSIPVELPGIKFDEKIILSSSGALDLKSVPKKIQYILSFCLFKNSDTIAKFSVAIFTFIFLLKFNPQALQLVFFISKTFIFLICKILTIILLA